MVASAGVTSYTASFKTQYLLTTNVSPANTGIVTGGGVYYDSGTNAPVTATPNAGYAFVSWTGPVTASAVSMTQPQTVTANFATLPDLTITKSHGGVHFSQGQNGVAYTITVGNIGQLPSGGTVTVTENVPAGLALVSMAGSGWTCPANTCTRTDAVASGGAYPPITVTVNVNATAPASVTNMATVSGGGEFNTSNDTASDPTIINPIVNVTSRMSVTQNGFGRNRATGIWAATLTVTNISGASIAGPIQAVLYNLTPGITMLNNNGTRNGSPYITISNGSFAASASVNLTIEFSNPSNGMINFTPEVDSGAYPPAPLSAMWFSPGFYAQYTDPNGASDIQVVYLDFGSSLFAPNSCIVGYVPVSNVFYLFSDNNASASGPAAAGSSSTLSNSQCTVSGSGGTAIMAGNNITIPLSISFASGFAGSKNVYGMVQNFSGAYSAWSLLGTWTP